MRTESGRPDFPADQLGKFAAGEEQPFHHTFVQVPARRRHAGATVGRMQHLHRGEDAHGGTVDPRQGLTSSVGQGLLRPQHAIGAFAITDAGEAALERAEIVGGIGVVVDGLNNMERRGLATGHGVGFRGCT
ncbi:hypothetical protein G6F35_016525 [Rhizopus arrhizus]|nr:hypothetical protein G6F35_016525 [Rhizopus arrhizus]